MASEEPNQMAKRSNMGWILALFILLAGNIAQGLYIYTLTARNEQQLSITQTRSQELEQATSSLDSLQTELYVKLEQVRKLGGDTTALALAKRELAADLKEAQGLRTADRTKLAGLRNKVDAYGQLLTSKDKEITQLRSERDRLFAYNKELRTDITKRDDSLAQEVKRGQELASKVAIASVLKVEGLHISYLDKNGNEREDEVIRAKKLDKFKVTFYIADNKVAQMGAKDVYFRGIDDGNTPITDAQGQGGNLLTADGIELPYTLRQTFIFDNQHPRITFITGTNKPANPGTYRFEIWSDGYKIGETQAVVR